MEKHTSNVIIFASGSGSNAENIILHSRRTDSYRVKAVFCNRKDAYVLTRAERLHVPHFVFSAADLRADTININGQDQPTSISGLLTALNADYIALAGFLLKIPQYLLDAFPQRILNVHPALLPSYGGKGMYGDRVHKAVIEAGETESGITIHLVDEHYDHGHILYQSRCRISPEDTPETLAAKIHELEKSYPEVLEHYIIKDRQLVN